MIGDYPSDVVRIFNKWAPLYDLVNLVAWGIREKVFYLTRPGRDAKILDVCTGTGKQALAFGRRGLEVMGIDLSFQMLKIAVRENSYNQVRFALSDAEELPFKDDNFDVSCISFGLHEMPYLVRKKVIREIVRVTKPQGKIVIIDYALPRGGIHKFLFYHLVRLYESEYFPEFIQTDLHQTIKEAGLRFNGVWEWAFGCVKIWKYKKLDRVACGQL